MIIKNNCFVKMLKTDIMSLRVQILTIISHKQIFIIFRKNFNIRVNNNYILYILYIVYQYCFLQYIIYKIYYK